MGAKQEKIKRAQQKAKRESDVFHCIAVIQRFIKELGYPEDIFWSAINKLKEKKATEKKAKQEIADAESRLKNLKNKYGNL